MKTRGTLFMVAAPSGGGKTSLVRALLERMSGIVLSVSWTSRAARADERNGVHYHFIDRETFDRMIAEDAFYEHANVHGDLKGTAREAVEPVLASGRDVLLEIDWQGAQQVRERAHGDCVGVFILPPSRAELERRLRARASDSESVIARRLANSREEISHAPEFDYIVVNDDFDTAIAELAAIVQAVRLRTPLQRTRHAALLAELLSDPPCA